MIFFLIRIINFTLKWEKKTSDIKNSRAFSTLRRGRLLNREGAAVPSDPPQEPGRKVPCNPGHLPSFFPSFHLSIHCYLAVCSNQGRQGPVEVTNTKLTSYTCTGLPGAGPRVSWCQVPRWQSNYSSKTVGSRSQGKRSPSGK